MPFSSIPFLENTDLGQRRESLNPDVEVAAQIRFFAEEGYLILRDCVQVAEIDKLVDQLKSRYSGKDYKQWRRVQDAWRDMDQVKRIACHEKIMAILEQFYQRRPIPFQTLNFCLGTEQKIHSDSIHFSSKPERYMCGVWVALEDVDDRNGPLVYYPKSHKLPIITMEDLGIDGSKALLNYDNYRLYEDYVELMIQTLNLQPASLSIKKGDAIIWSANLLHGGAPIIDPARTRFSQVTHYYFSDCIYYTPLFSNTYQGKLEYRQITDISTGKLVANQYLGQKVGNAISNSNLPRRILNVCRKWTQPTAKKGGDTSSYS